jgi:hypothetical protein
LHLKHARSRSRRVVVVRRGKDEFRVEMRMRRVMGLRVGKSANAFNLRIYPPQSGA